jgi:hypothetical protein
LRQKGGSVGCSVSRRDDARYRGSSPSSRSRPRKLVNAVGRLALRVGPGWRRPAPGGRAFPAAGGWRGEGRAAASRRAISGGVSRSAGMSRRTVSCRGAVFPRSRPWTLRRPNPARSASASWVRPALSRYSCSRRPNSVDRGPSSTTVPSLISATSPRRPVRRF